MSNILTLLGRRATMMNKPQGGGGLPSGYTQYDWVQADSTTGSPVIDTQISIQSGDDYNDKWTFVGKFAKCEEFPSDYVTYSMFLNRTGTYDNCYGIRRAGSKVVNKIRFNYNDRFGGAENLVSTVIDIGVWHDFTLTHKENDRGGTLTLDGDKTVGVDTAANDKEGNLFLLGIGENPTYYCRFARFKVYDTGTLVADMVPAKRDSDNVVGFYDVVRSIFLVPSTEGVTLLCGNGFEDFIV